MDQGINSVRPRKQPRKPHRKPCIPGDLNGDGYDDAVETSEFHFNVNDYAVCSIYFGGLGMDGESDHLFAGGLRWGSLNVDGGDLDNDGFADLVVSEVSAHPDVDYGRLAVYFGGADMDTTPDVAIEGPRGFGETVTWIGDMTGDGWPEFAVSNPSGAGEIYIYTMEEVQAGETPVSQRIWELRIIPNPFRGPTMIGFDVGGHLVQTLGLANQWDETRRLL